MPKKAKFDRDAAEIMAKAEAAIKNVFKKKWGRIYGDEYRHVTRREAKQPFGTVSRSRKERRADDAEYWGYRQARRPLTPVPRSAPSFVPLQTSWSRAESSLPPVVGGVTHNGFLSDDPAFEEALMEQVRRIEGAHEVGFRGPDPAAYAALMNELPMMRRDRIIVVDQVCKREVVVALFV